MGAENLEVAVEPQDVVAQPEQDVAQEQGSSSVDSDRLRFAESQAQFYKDQLMALQRSMQQPQAPEPSFNDDDIISAGDVRNLVESAVARVRQETVKDRNDRQLREARDRYSDYDSVIASVDKFITPKMFDLIMADENPAEFAYWLGKNHYSVKRNQQRTQVTANPERIKENLSAPKGVSEISGTQTNQNKSWLTASKEEFEKEKARILYG